MHYYLGVARRKHVEGLLGQSYSFHFPLLGDAALTNIALPLHHRQSPLFPGESLWFGWGPGA